MIIVIGSAQVKPGQMDKALQLSCEHVARSRAEPGCTAHNVSVDVEDDHRLVFVEYWQDLAALKTHFAVPESGAFAAALTKLAAAKPEVKIFEAGKI
jgi:quinol monooxygenase YgiN